MEGEREILRFDGHPIGSIRQGDGQPLLLSAVDVITALEMTSDPAGYWDDVRRGWEGSAPGSAPRIVAGDMLEADAIRKRLPLLRTARADDFARWLSLVEAEQTPSQASLAILPLTNSAFAPGHAEEAIDSLGSDDLRAIGRAELHFYRGQARECVDVIAPYLANDDPTLRLSACMLGVYANLTLANPSAAREALSVISDYLGTLEDSIRESGGLAPTKLQASCVLAAHIGTVLLHLPSKNLPSMGRYGRYLPDGLRVLAAYVAVHAAYLEGDYERGLGLAEGALLTSGDVFPIPLVYLRCAMAMCSISLMRQAEAEENLYEAWRLARPDGLVEPFVEHHGPLQGLVEHCIRKGDPQAYDAICSQVVAFSRGWMRVHNPRAESKVTDKLSPMEFSIAMLASRGWTNRQIASYLDLSPNTVKHHLTHIMATLGVSHRDEIGAFVLK